MENILLVRAVVDDERVSADTQWLESNTPDVDGAVQQALYILQRDDHIVVLDDNPGPLSQDDQGYWGHTVTGLVWGDDGEYPVDVRVVLMWGTPYKDKAGGK